MHPGVYKAHEDTVKDYMREAEDKAARGDLSGAIFRLTDALDAALQLIRMQREQGEEPR